MNIEPIPWLRVGAFVRERETGEIYRITDCPETVSLRDIGGGEVEIEHVDAERHVYLTTFLREFTPARKPKDWQEPVPRPAFTGPGTFLRGYAGQVTLGPPCP